MLTSATVENFRGIERLHVEGLGRVNLIIGRNDSGKTALMEALELAWVPEDAGLVLKVLQETRHPGADLWDFDDFWLPIFRKMDARRGFSIKGTDERGRHTGLVMRQARTAQLAVPAETSSSQEPMKSWALEYEVTREQMEQMEVRVVRGDGNGVRFPPMAILGDGLYWITPGPAITAADIRVLSKLKQQGRDGEVINLLRLINPRVSGVELLAPSGERVLVFVRLEHDGLVPLSMMGEGAKRCFEFSVALASGEDPLLCIDEVENGLHHSILEPLWEWIAEASVLRGTQVFATTHSEECVQAACRAFKARDDDGLRVIRLDKQEHETRAVVYDRNLVEAAGRMGVEIRG
jgi:ABC-type branched-subunit amino acid transport system ATPase component